jgi:hypothetical protein
VENSAAYLLPHLTAGTSLLGRRVRARHHHRRLRAALAPGRVSASTHRTEVIADRASRTGDVRRVRDGDIYALSYDDDSFDIGTRIKCCNTSLIPSARSLRWDA